MYIYIYIYIYIFRHAKACVTNVHTVSEIILSN